MYFSDNEMGRYPHFVPKPDVDCSGQIISDTHLGGFQQSMPRTRPEMLQRRLNVIVQD